VTLAVRNAAEHFEAATAFYEISEDDRSSARVMIEFATLHCEGATSMP
jgi:hypothetical protein